MTPDEGAVALRAVVFFVGLVVVVKLMWWPTAITEFRQRLFQIRHDLFLFMADGNVTPRDTAYVHLRSTLNGLIRTAERVGVFRLALGAALMKHEGEEYNQRMKEALATYTPHVRRQMQVYWAKMSQEIVLHIWRTSWGLRFIVLIARGIKATTKFKRAMVSVTEAEAFSEECEDRAAA